MKKGGGWVVGRGYLSGSVGNSNWQVVRISVGYLSECGGEVGGCGKYVPEAAGRAPRNFETRV